MRSGLEGKVGGGEALKIRQQLVALPCLLSGELGEGG